MFNKFELVGAGISISLMAFAIYLVQIEATLFSSDANQVVSAVQSRQPNVAVVSEAINANQIRADAYREAENNRDNIERMVIDDIKLGVGTTVKDGDTVAVHYVGTFQDGTEFDNSKKRGVPFEFKIGEGAVIKGWEEGLIGMQIGGQRVLVVPPEMAYGENGIGPIPPNSTLVFSIELIEIK